MLTGFDALVGTNPYVLILGSMPSNVSLAKKEYYGYGQNRFWKILAAYYQEILPDYEAKKQLLFKHHLALWDVIGACEREGSLDSNIRHEQVNDIVSFLKEHGSIALIICNGKKSETLFRKHFQEQIDLEVCFLPSTSNANRTISETKLYQKWFEALDKAKRKER